MSELKNKKIIPYPGLRPFKQSEHNLFFGRRLDTVKLLEKLAYTHFVALIGPSGCGKSSLLNAGLIGGLISKRLSAKDIEWKPVSIHAGPSPFALLLKNLCATLDQVCDTEALVQDARRIAKESDNGLHELLDISQSTVFSNKNVRLLILIDQFEQLLKNYHSQKEETKQFVKFIMDTAEPGDDKYHHPNQIYILISLRSETLDSCAYFPGLPDKINEGVFFLKTLGLEKDESDLREIINGPLYYLAYNENLEEPFDDQDEIIQLCSNPQNSQGEFFLTQIREENLADSMDTLPLLQHALRTLWVRGDQNPQQMNWATYQSKVAPSLSTSINATAEQVYLSLCKLQRIVAAILLREMIKTVGREHVSQVVTIDYIVDLIMERGYPLRRRKNFYETPVKTFFSDLDPNPDQKGVILETVVKVIYAFRLKDFDLIRTDPETKYTHRFELSDATQPEYYKNYHLSFRHEAIIRNWDTLQAIALEQDSLSKLWSEIEDKTGEIYGGDLDRVNILFNRFCIGNTWIDFHSSGEDMELIFNNLQKSVQQRQEQKKRELDLKTRELQFEHEKRKTELELSYRTRDLDRIAVGDFHKTALFALVALLVVILSGGLFWFSALNHSKTQALVEANIKQAVSALKREDYNEASEALTETYVSDNTTSLAIRRTRDLIAGYSKIYGTNHSQTSLVSTAQSEGGLLTATADPTNRYLVAGGEYNRLTLLDMNTKQLDDNSSITQSTKIYDIAVFPDGQQIIAATETGNYMGELSLWTVGYNKINRIQVTEINPYPSALAVRPNGDYLFTGHMDGELQVWKLKNQQLEFLDNLPKKDSNPLHTHSGLITDIVFTPDGKMFATTSTDGKVIFWNTETQTPTDRVLHHEGAQTIAFNHTGTLIATAGSDTKIRLWHQNGELLRELNGHKRIVFTLLFDDKNNRIYSGSRDADIRVWDIASGVCLHVFQGHSADVTGLVLHDQTLYSASADGTIRHWPVRLPAQHFVPTPGGVLSFAASSTDKLVAGLDNGTVELYTLTTRRRIASNLQAHKSAILDVAITPQGSYIASGGLDSTVNVWPIENKPLGADPQYSHHSLDDGAVYALAFDPQGRHLAMAYESGKVGLLEVETGKNRWYGLHEGQVYSVAFQPGMLFTAGEHDHQGIVRGWPLAADGALSDKAEIEFFTPDAILYANFSADGRYLATGGIQGVVRVYDMSVRPLENTPVKTFIGHENSIYRTLFTPDGTVLMSLSADQTLHAWDFGWKQRELFTWLLPIGKEEDRFMWDTELVCTDFCRLVMPAAENRFVVYELKGLSYEK